MNSNGFTAKLKSALKMDFTRAFASPPLYITLGACFVLSVLIPVMTGFFGGGEGFTCVWQAIGSTGGGQSANGGMSLTGMCNINLVYFAIAVYVCVFVGEEFGSGFCKNLFAANPDKSVYITAKTFVTFAAGALMIAAYFIGALIGGAVAGLDFSASAAGGTVGGIVACMLSKIFLCALFASIALVFSTVGKQRLWLSVLCSLGACALLFTMIPLVTPVDGTLLNPLMCLAGGAGAAAGLGAIGKCVLNNTSLA